MSNPYFDRLGQAYAEGQRAMSLANPSLARAAGGPGGCAPYGAPASACDRPEEIMPGCKDVMFGIDSGAANIAAAATATLTVTPQKRYLAQRITLSANVANNFVITDIRVGVDPILITVGAISAAVFIQDSTVPAFQAIVSEVGTDFTITVTNISGAAQRFTATILGKYLPYAPEVASLLARG